jgi:hypothetical protein
MCCGHENVIFVPQNITKVIEVGAFFPDEPRSVANVSPYLTVTSRLVGRCVAGSGGWLSPRDDQRPGNLAASERARLTADCNDPTQS